MKKMKALQKGFTLVEMVVVITIIGILAAIIVPSLINYVGKANRKADIVTARLIGTTMVCILTECPEYSDVFYSSPDAKRADYLVKIEDEEYYYRNVARACGTKTNLNTQKGFQFYMNGDGWEQTNPKYNALTDELNTRIEEIIGGDKDMSYIPMRSSGYKHPADQCNHDQRDGQGKSTSKRPGVVEKDTYSYTDRWLIGYRISGIGAKDKKHGAIEVWAGDSYGRAANGPRCRLWPAPPSYY